MVQFEFDAQKNVVLQEQRGISFEQFIVLMETGNILSVKPHRNQKLYPHQHMIEVLFNDYIYLIPCVVTGKKVFLKTIYPSRKASKEYKKGAENG